MTYPPAGAPGWGFGGGEGRHVGDPGVEPEARPGLADLANTAASRQYVQDLARAQVIDIRYQVGSAEALEGLLAGLGAPLDAVVNILVPDEELVRRLSGRRVCGACGTGTHVDETEGGSCDDCGGELRTRDDDQPETVRRRLTVYREQTAPVLAWYEASSVPLVPVDGVGTVAEVQHRIREGIGA